MGEQTPAGGWVGSLYYRGALYNKASISEHLHAMGGSLEKYDLPVPDTMAVNAIDRYHIEHDRYRSLY